jgi:hypothetical protein
VIFGILAACNLTVAGCIYTAMPEFILRFKNWLGKSVRLLVSRSSD